MLTVTTLLLSGLAPCPPAIVQDPDPVAAEELQQLQDEYDDALAAFMELFQAADEAGQQELYERQYPDPNGWAPRFLEIAERYPGTETACGALTWVATRTFGEHGEEALATLVEEYFESERMAEVVFHLSRAKDGETTLRRLVEESPHRAVQGLACYAIALSMAPRGHPSPEWPGRDEYVMWMERVAKDFTDVEFRGARIGPMAEGALFALDNLQVGKVAPEIEGEDVDGVPFKLTDYRGKVVMLDFWGHW